MHFAHRRLLRFAFAFTLSILWLASTTHAAKPGKTDSSADSDAPDIKMSKRDEKANAKAGRDTTADAESRQMARIREKLDVTDDAEWAIISERITKVEELRRSPVATTRGSLSSGDKVKRNARGATASPEMEALRAAVGDQYPDAEIKSRLARVHEAYAQHETQLIKAQAELRAVLTVRQEAIAVMAGLLPP